MKKRTNIKDEGDKDDFHVLSPNEGKNNLEKKSSVFTIMVLRCHPRHI